MSCSTNREGLSQPSCARRPSSPWILLAWILLLAGTILLSACGSTASSGNPPSAGSLAGNWQFTLTNTPDLTATSGLQGGFLLQKNASATGQVVYSNTLQGSLQGPCNSGAAAVTGTISGQAVNLTAVAGSQTFTLTGNLNSDSSMSGTYTVTPGPVVAGTTTPCGAGTDSGTTLTWTAKSVPALTGSITGNFHSSTSFNSGFGNQNFPLTGVLTQGSNIGASSATITGSLNFVDPITLLNDYPCIPGGLVNVNGQISGDTVVLQLIGIDGSDIGQIGIPASQANNAVGAQPVTFESTAKGYVLHSNGTGYVVNTKSCPTNASVDSEDGGYLCIGLDSTSACQQPITLSPAVLSFAPQLLGSTKPSTNTTTLTNNSGNEQTGLTLSFIAASGSSSDTGQTDFTNLPNFTESDTCASSPGSPFNLLPGQSCSITIAFAPQESCTWLPNQGGVPPARCPIVLRASLTIDNVASVDPDATFTVPITGTGISFVQPSLPELDFGAEAFGEASLPQLLTFTNQGPTPVQILPKGSCVNSFIGEVYQLPHPLVAGSNVAGLQVVNNAFPNTDNFTINYSCDFDNNSGQSNFHLSADTCGGTLLMPQASCSLQIAFIPQSILTYNGALDYFLELNTVQCADPVNDPPSQSNPCEFDGGRFPVELRANFPSPLRMAPAAGFDFGNVPSGKSSVTQTVTLLNDPSSANTDTVSFAGKFVVSGNYTETDDCPFSLAPAASCTLTITFKPSGTGRSAGTIAINYKTTSDGSLQNQTVYLRGTGQ